MWDKTQQFILVKDLSTKRSTARLNKFGLREPSMMMICSGKK